MRKPLVRRLRSLEDTERKLCMTLEHRRRESGESICSHTYRTEAGARYALEREDTHYRIHIKMKYLISRRCVLTTSIWVGFGSNPASGV